MIALGYEPEGRVPGRVPIEVLSKQTEFQSPGSRTYFLSGFEPAASTSGTQCKPRPQGTFGTSRE